MIGIGGLIVLILICGLVLGYLKFDPKVRTILIVVLVAVIIIWILLWSGVWDTTWFPRSRDHRVEIR